MHAFWKNQIKDGLFKFLGSSATARNIYYNENTYLKVKSFVGFFLSYIPPLYRRKERKLNGSGMDWKRFLLEVSKRVEIRATQLPCEIRAIILLRLNKTSLEISSNIKCYINAFNLSCVVFPLVKFSIFSFGPRTLKVNMGVNVIVVQPSDYLWL